MQKQVESAIGEIKKKNSDLGERVLVFLDELQKKEEEGKIPNEGLLNAARANDLIRTCERGISLVENIINEGLGEEANVILNIIKDDLNSLAPDRLITPPES